MISTEQLHKALYREKIGLEVANMMGIQSFRLFAVIFHLCFNHFLARVLQEQNRGLLKQFLGILKDALAA